MSPAAKRRLLAVLAAALVVVVGSVTVEIVRHWATVERGHALFEGRSELKGSLSGQTEALPTAAIRCANCHMPQPQAGGPDAAAYANALDRSWLSQSRSRHGGPPSRYDLQSFCVLLHTGHDPAYVIISQAMPHYDLTEPACADLWAYVQSR